MTTTLRVHFDGVVLVPEGPVDLPIGRSMEVRIENPMPPKIANATVAAVFAALDRLPPVSEEDVAELERAIEEGKIPARPGGVFDDLGEE